MKKMIMALNTKQLKKNAIAKGKWDNGFEGIALLGKPNSNFIEVAG